MSFKVMLAIRRNHNGAILVLQDEMRIKSLSLNNLYVGEVFG